MLPEVVQAQAEAEASAPVAEVAPAEEVGALVQHPEYHALRSKSYSRRSRRSWTNWLIAALHSRGIAARRVLLAHQAEVQPEDAAAP